METVESVVNDFVSELTETDKMYLVNHVVDKRREHLAGVIERLRSVLDDAVKIANKEGLYDLFDLSDFSLKMDRIRDLEREIGNAQVEIDRLHKLSSDLWSQEQKRKESE